MHRVAISSTGLFTPPEVITNEELVTAFNACLLYTSPSPRD